MYRYRVEFFVNGIRISHCYRSGHCRADAYHAAIDSEEAKKAWEMAKKKSGTFTWDATVLNEGTAET